jgi:hypothetical protein
VNHPNDMTDERAERVRNLLVETVRNEPEAHRRRVRSRIALWAPVAVLSVGAATVAGTAIVSGANVDTYEIVHCLESAERGPNGQYLEAQAVLEQERVDSATIHDAVRICTEMWEQGALPLGGDPLEPTPGRHDAPDYLTPCVMPDGSPAIVPGEAEVCRALGLAPFE